MKLTFLVRSLDVGGAERQLVNLVKGLHNRGHQILIITFYPEGALEKDLYKAEIPVTTLKKHGRWDIIGFLTHLFKILSREKPDILHSYLEVPNIITILLKPFFTSMCIVWGIRASNMNLSNYDWLIRLSYLIEQKVAKFADLIIVNSKAGFENAQKNGFPSNKMMIICNGVDTSRFRIDIEARQRMRTYWNVREDQVLIGLVGRLDPIKGHSTFLKAAALFAQEREDVRFICVGDGSSGYRQKLIAIGEMLGLRRCLIWAGEMQDMPAVYNAMDIVTSSSYGEGFSNAISEAMACGIPCVVTDVGDSALIVGDTGIVVPPGEPEKLASGWAAILKKIDGDCVDIGYISRQRIVSQFSLEALVDKTLKALSDLL